MKPKEIKVSRLSFILSCGFIIISSLALLDLLLGHPKDPVDSFIVGSGFFIFGIWSLVKCLRYRLYLSPGNIVEVYGVLTTQQRTIEFSTIDTLDCEIPRAPRGLPETFPIFNFKLKDNSYMKFKTTYSASHWDITEWCKKEYPNIILGEGIRSLRGQFKWLYSSY